MKLKQLLANVDVKKANVQMDMEITSVVYDSRKVTPGCMFVAVVGYATDGNKYIPMALEKGAAVVVTAKEQDDTVPYVQVASDRLALAQIGGNFFDHPGDSMKLIGITGTSGKWTQIAYKGGVAYVFSQYVSGVKPDEDVAGKTATIVNCKSFVNVREKANSSSKKLGTAKKGATYTVKGLSGNWVQVNYDGKTAYIYKRYVKIG